MTDEEKVCTIRACADACELVITQISQKEAPQANMLEVAHINIAVAIELLISASIAICMDAKALRELVASVMAEIELHGAEAWQ